MQMGLKIAAHLYSRTHRANRLIIFAPPHIKRGNLPNILAYPRKQCNPNQKMFTNHFLLA
jgi:hypothetical protein